MRDFPRKLEVGCGAQKTKVDCSNKIVKIVMPDHRYRYIRM